jgi:16S rRNA (guanine1207-N2)-methyltransferase
MPEFSFDDLRRYPDLEAPNLFAVDASDRLILDEASAALAASSPGEVVIIGDHYGALTLGAIALHGVEGVRTHQDSRLGELALAANARALRTDDDDSPTLGFRSLPLGAELLSGAKLVLLQLPRSLSELDEIAGEIARNADSSVVVYAGGRIKHISVTMNEVLLRHFATLDISLARQKSRVLVARGAKPSASAFPELSPNADLGITIAAHGAVFAGAKLDLGTRFLLSLIDRAKPDAADAIDLGSGTGVIATSIALARPGIRVLASDVSAAAVASSRATALVNGVADRITVVQDVGLESQPGDSADLVLLNPPFHVGSTVHTGIASALFADAARVLRPGGELWTVFNSHLDYRPTLQRLVGPTREVARNTKFTVTASIAR